MDQLVICDAGFPIPEETNRIDLALKLGYPSFFEVLDVVLEELEVEKIIIADEVENISPKCYREILNRFPNTPIETIRHEEFKKQSTQAKGIIRTGECVPYSNIILVSGVVF